MLNLRTALAMLCLSGGLLASTPIMAADCAALATLSLHGVTSMRSAAQPAGTLPPDPMSAMTGGAPTAVAVGPHCLVEGIIDERAGVNGRYGVRFQLRMPEAWNGRFLFQGGGGTDGFIAPAIGAIPSTGTTATPALKRGYAVVSMNGGHDGMNLAFAEDQQARLDLGYAAIGKVTNVAKALVQAFYRREPDQSFFMGCSNGGREAMMAAQRYPTEFDGIVAGNPGFRLSKAAIGALWDVRQIEKIAPKGALWQAFTQQDLDVVSNAILAKCDAKDGLDDGVVANPGQCRFDAESLRGQLPDQKVDALAAIMSGVRDASGHELYSDWPWDPAINTPGWRAWKLGTEQQPGLHAAMSVPSLARLFLTPPRDSIPQVPDYGALAQNVASVGGYFDADETYLSTFAKRGGKMVIFQGLADPIFSANDIARWVGDVRADTGTEVARLFMVPGMTHCGGGSGYEDFDPLTTLESWVKTGQAPETMVARSPSRPGQEMPLCAWPAHAQYKGGDLRSADSFVCQVD